MSTIELALIATAVCFIFIFLRMPIAFAFGIIGFVGIWLLRGFDSALSILGYLPYTTASMYTWSVIPLYALLGYIAKNSRLGEEFFDGISRWVGHFRGGLASAVVLANAGFGAVSGDSLGASATFTAMTLPEMRKKGYKDTLILGSIAGSTLLAQLIPPSFVFIIYGALTGASISKLFIAGLLPGIILIIFYLITIYIWCKRSPEDGPRGPKTTWREKLGAGSGMWAILVIFMVIIIGLYLGIFTPTEAGAVAAFIVIVMGVTRKRLTWEGFKESLIGSGLLVGMVGFMLIGTMIFNTLLGVTGAPLAIKNFLTSLPFSPSIMLLSIGILFFILGMFVDGLAMFLLLIPIFYPVVEGMGVDLIHFGVVANVSTLVGMITPPFGLVVFAIKGVAKDVPIFTIFRGAAPFIIPNVLLMLLVIFIPEISLLLPNMMLGE